MNLADRYAALKAQMDSIKAEFDAVKAEIRAEGRAEIVGTDVIVTLGLSERTTLDPAAVKKLLTADQIAACSNTTTIETIRVKPRLTVAA